jgi:hypothetical protein
MQRAFFYFFLFLLPAAVQAQWDDWEFSSKLMKERKVKMIHACKMYDDTCWLEAEIYFDELGRKIKVEDIDADSMMEYVNYFLYDKKGRLDVDSSCDAKGKCYLKYKEIYDSKGRLKQELVFNNGVQNERSDFEYKDGEMTEYLTTGGKRKRGLTRVLDKEGRLTQAISSRGDTTEWISMEQQFDVYGNLHSFIDYSSKSAIRETGSFIFNEAHLPVEMRVVNEDPKESYVIRFTYTFY